MKLREFILGCLLVSGMSNGKENKTIIFVSSEEHDGNFGGKVGADQFCQNLADRASLPGTYVALLSYGVEKEGWGMFKGTVSCKSRPPANGELDGLLKKPVFDTWGLPVSSSLKKILENRIMIRTVNFDESGRPRRSRLSFAGVMTGVISSRVAVCRDFIVNCSGYRKNSRGEKTILGGGFGIMDSGTDAGSCDTPRPIFCIRAR